MSQILPYNIPHADLFDFQMAPKFMLCLVILLTGGFVVGINSDFRQISYQDLQSSIDQYVERPSGTFTYAQFLHDSITSNELFVGAKDALYRFELRSLRLLEKAIWEAPANKTAFCIVKGQTEQNCRNFIKVLLISGRKLFACGTNAFSPQCSWRRLDRLSDVLDWVDGIAKCPYNPAANITALISDTGDYYIGGPTDFTGSDVAVYRTNIGKHGKQTASLRTNQYNSKWLDNPQFIGSFETNHFVYAVFRENAIEYSNCGKMVYSRVARFCKNDIGGQLIHKDNWSTFVKARLNCSMPGEYPFYFNEIQSVYYLKKENIMYATFSTPSNSITGSAVCAFNLSAINAAFQGPFHHQETPSEPWQSHKPQHQHHSECRMSQSRGTQFLDGAKYQLMHNAIQPVSITPLHSIKLQRYNHIVVDVIDTKHYKNVHVIFVATDEGIIKKIIVLPRTQETCVVETWHLSPPDNPVRITGMHTFKDTRSVYVSTDDGLVRIDTEHCRRHVSRTSCLNSMDPYCGWNERQEACTPAPDDNPLARFWQQSFTSCPILNTPVDGGWSTWSDWSPCSLKPGNDSNPADKCLCRSRQCNNPSAQNGGKTCVGNSIQVTNCTVHGGWTPWSAWSECSASCGPAYRSRFRTCGNPSPAHGGRVCVGQDSQQVLCMQNPPCQSEPTVRVASKEANWGPWSQWEQCTASCGGGYRVRRRRCDSSSSQEGGLDCLGNSVEYELCNTHDCPSVKKYGPWSQWMVANSSGMNSSYDGYVVEKRFRCSCNAPASHPTQVRVAIAKEEERYCRSDGTCNAPNSQQRWSAWSAWSDCSAKCGGGYQSRSRTCLGRPDECVGPAFISRSCNHYGCYGKWSCWSEWSPCSVSCGTGSQTRSRVCLSREKDGEAGGCNGPSNQERSCEMHNCTALESSSLSGTAISTGVVLAYCLAGFIVGLAVACFIFFFYTRSKRTGIPSSPHYLPSKQNPYITIPLQDAPTKRPSYCSTSNRDRNSSAFIMNNTGSGTLRHHKNEYDTATVKRNSHNTMNNGHTRTDCGTEIPDKYY